MTSFAAPGALDVLVNDMEISPDQARAILGHLQLKLNELFGGLPWRSDVAEDILSFLEEACPAPATHRWRLSDINSGVVYANLVSRNGVPEGYSFAARVTIGFDGGNHALRGDLWKHDHCGCLIFPGDHQAHERFHAELRGQAA